MNTEAIKQQLQETQASLTKRLEAIKADFAAGRSADFAEQVTEAENDEVLQQLRAESEQELRDVNLALDKIKRGEYGRCENCNQSIQSARLQALPYARHCINCASAMN